MKESIQKFVEGVKYVHILAPVSKKELTKIEQVSEAYREKACIKFIPASGAATRMFSELYQYLEDEVETDFVKTFFDDLETFAFYESIKGTIQSRGLSKYAHKGKKEIIRLILDDQLNYGNLPKALIKMHVYDHETLTPIDEHIYEGIQYLGGEAPRLHFTISESHETLFKEYLKKALKGKCETQVSYSYQKSSTDTLAVDMKNEPFLDEQGRVLYRAGGHGALIENLNDLDGDIIFIKNVDNVCHRDYVSDTIEYKKALASLGYKVKNQMDAYITDLISGAFDLDEIKGFINNTLNIHYQKTLTKEIALKFLNRPLRVCGMVKNEGEPGGGPFLVDNGDYTDLQICEKAEINLSDPEQMQRLRQSQYFNPVDLICFVKDYKGEKFNLLDYINYDRYFISEKTYKGRQLKALEHPGLWNGAMHHWNTLFVEVPLTTFNPVKTVNDLLRDGHRPLDEASEIDTIA